MRFQHIGLTAKTSLHSLQRLTSLRDLRTTLAALDDEINSLRNTFNPNSSSSPQVVDVVGSDESNHDESGKRKEKKGKYDDIADIPRLERLVKAKEKTKTALESKTGWVGMDRAREEVSS